MGITSGAGVRTRRSADSGGEAVSLIAAQYNTTVLLIIT